MLRRAGPELAIPGAGLAHGAVDSAYFQHDLALSRWGTVAALLELKASHLVEGSALQAAFEGLV
jgi:hypothetical protein